MTFTQTTIMEMGQPPSVEDADPAMWVRARQYTGRIVTVTNAKIFDEPVFNYTRQFPFLWEEMSFPVSFKDDRARAEKILLDVAEKHTVKLAELGSEALQELKRRYLMESGDVKHRVYWRITDNWLEMTGTASATFEIIGLPPVQVAGSLPLHTTAHRTRSTFRLLFMRWRARNSEYGGGHLFARLFVAKRIRSKEIF